jgi:hypothetical protein
MSMFRDLQVVVDEMLMECPEDSGNYSVGLCYCQYHTWARAIHDAVGWNGITVPEPPAAEMYEAGEAV